MRYFKLTFLFATLVYYCGYSQTLTDLQMQNARATGFGVVAARNPGKSFSIYMIQWDGINTLEHNANTQINSGWHAQAVIKGEYFNHPFDGTDFTKYSSVLLSEEEFETYKHTGSQWWIVCSNLPPFSSSGIESSILVNNSNVGIGTTAPSDKLTIEHSVYGPYAGSLINGGITINSGRSSYDGTYAHNGITFKGDHDNSSFIYQIHDSNTSSQLVIGANNQERIRINDDGNVGIGTKYPREKLSVNGRIRAHEIKVETSNWPDYVFEDGYQLKGLEDLETFIKANRHLPDIPNEAQVKIEGIELGQMNKKLLKKIEELTLYIIELNKTVQRQQMMISELMSEK